LRFDLRRIWYRNWRCRCPDRMICRKPRGVPPRENVGGSVTKLPCVRNEFSFPRLKCGLAVKGYAGDFGSGKSSAAAEAVGKMPITLSTFVSFRLESIMPLQPA